MVQPSNPMPRLQVLPGTLVVTFIVHVGSITTALVVGPGRFLDGLKAAADALSFAELQRDEERLDDLLPWAGNV
ncbi:MAG: hypothetical protein MUF03_09410 [Rubrivivax sp.]|jgi:hypothetical protein|nr:hypothetical protein [Rubrivivax sp.]